MVCPLLRAMYRLRKHKVCVINDLIKKAQGRKPPDLIARNVDNNVLHEAFNESYLQNYKWKMT